MDAIISVGYRVNSLRATQFRQWATKVLRTYTIQGYVLDKKRLKNGQIFDEEYFEHLLDEIREIRASERKFYQKITDIYSTAVDYSKDAKTTKDFFATVQNKLHFAIHGHTAAEVILERADHKKEYMGLTTWKNAPDGKIVKADVSVAKNYLSMLEMKDLNQCGAAGEKENSNDNGRLGEEVGCISGVERRNDFTGARQSKSRNCKGFCRK